MKDAGTEALPFGFSFCFSAGEGVGGTSEKEVCVPTFTFCTLGLLKMGELAKKLGMAELDCWLMLSPSWATADSAGGTAAAGGAAASSGAVSITGVRGAGAATGKEAAGWTTGGDGGLVFSTP